MPGRGAATWTEPYIAAGGHPVMMMNLKDHPQQEFGLCEPPVPLCVL